MEKMVSVLLAAVILVSCLAGCTPAVPAGAISTADTTGALSTTAAPTETTVPTETAAARVPLAEYEIPADSILNRIPKYTYGAYEQIRNLDASGEYYLDDTMTSTVTAEDALGGGEMLMFMDVPDDKGLIAYEKTLENQGFRLYAENDMAGNQYATWISDEIVVTLMYLPNYQRVNIIAEPMRDLPLLETENVYEDLGIENSVILVSTQFVGKQIGMCLMFQLCDGSFIIVDSGFGWDFDERGEEYADYWQNNAKEIYHTLEKLSPDRDHDGDKDQKDIVIAAWFFTHPHLDHIGGFIPFAELYADQVTLEQAVINFPNYETHKLFINDRYEAGEKADAVAAAIGRVQDAVAEFEGAKLIEAHAGQRFFLRDAVVEMLYTWELEPEMIERMNSSSLVFSVELGETRTMVLGDCGNTSSNVLTDLYGNFLKSDFQTVAHHGHTGATRELNLTIDADIILWPAGDEDYRTYKNKDYNVPFFNTVSNYIAGDRVTVIPLPYTGSKNVVKWDVIEKIYGQS